MTQPDLFQMPQSFTRRGDSIVPPTAREVAKERRDRGIGSATNHAAAISPDWSARALQWVRLYAVTHELFLAEDVRAEAETDGFAVPPDARAWGGVMRRAAREGVIESHGYAPASSSNLSPKVLWRSLATNAAR